MIKIIVIFSSIFILYFPLKFLGTILLNIVGIPGSLIALKSTNKKENRFILGSALCLIAHTYIYFSIIVYLMNWTRSHINPESLSKYFIWFFCLILITGSMEAIYKNAKMEFDKNNASLTGSSKYLNPQIESLSFLRSLVFIGFFIFLFYPNLSNPLWSWVNNIGFLI
jgi:uncharacterized membrane protein (DUF485 family)